MTHGNPLSYPSCAPQPVSPARSGGIVSDFAGWIKALSGQLRGWELGGSTLPDLISGKLLATQVAGGIELPAGSVATMASLGKRSRTS
jgi:hypothetical protein